MFCREERGDTTSGITFLLFWCGFAEVLQGCLFSESCFAFFLEFITIFFLLFGYCVGFFLLLWGVRLSLVVFDLILDVVFVDFVLSIVSVGVL